MLLAATLGERPLLAVGFVFYAAGDALLLDKHRFFLHGLVAFLLGHLLVTAGLLRGGAPHPLGLVAGGAVAVAMTAALWPGLRPVLRVAVPVYGASLAALLWAATAQGPWATLGAALFVLSDAILGWNRFRGPVPGGDLSVLATYYLAIGLLATG